MRARNIKPGFWSNEDVGKLSHTNRLLFIGLWCLADRDGKLEDRPERIRHQLFGYDKKPVNIESGLCNLMSLHLITRYDMQGHGYILINSFKNHQAPHPHEKRSKIPDNQDCRDMSLHVTKCKPDIMNPDIINNKPPYSPPGGDATISSFDQFWKAYPKKVGKDAAKRMWDKKRNKPPLNTILNALKDQKEWDSWKKENGQYIPNPATWLNQGRWNDEPIKAKKENIVI